MRNQTTGHSDIRRPSVTASGLAIGHTETYVKPVKRGGSGNVSPELAPDRTRFHLNPERVARIANAPSGSDYFPFHIR